MAIKNNYKHMKKLITLSLLLILIFTNFIFAIKPSDKKVVAHRIKSPIIIDGILNEDLYTKHAPIDDFTQKNPNEGEPASERTNVWVGYDDEFIYFSAKLFDSHPDKIDRMLVRRDNFQNSDWFIVGIDPFFDRRTGFLFAVNAGGSVADATVSNDTRIDGSWDGVWESKATVDKDGWNVEIKIPFSQLRFKEASEMKWGINFERDIKRKNEESFFVMVPKDENGYISRMATLTGLKNVKMKQRIEFLPYIVQKAQFLKNKENDPFYKENQFNTSIGGDFKIGLGSNLNLDGTVNPDFGQVEVDPAVVNLSAFETFYEEKRPFFIEGSSIFDFGRGGSNNNWSFNFGNPELFYSRRIGRSPQIWNNVQYDYSDRPGETRILGAAKLSGKIDESWSIGLLSSVTERTYETYELDGNRFKKEIEPLTHYGVFRTQKQFNDSKQALGVILTSVNRDASNPVVNEQLVNQAYTFGTDGWMFLDDDETYVVTAYAVGSYVSGSKSAITEKQMEPYRYAQRPDATYAPLDTNLTSLSGWFSRVTFNKQKGNFFVNASLGAVSPGFEHNDLGFQWHANKINGHVALGYRWYKTDGIFRTKSIFGAHFQTYDFEGDKLSDGYFIFSHFELENYINFGMDGGLFGESIASTLTRGGPKALSPASYFFSFNASSDRRKDYLISANGNLGGDELGGNSYRVGLNFQWKPLPQIEFSIGPSYSKNIEKLQWVTSVEDNLASITYGTRYIFGEMDQKTISANIRLNWTFTPKLSLQLFIQPLISVGKYSNFKELAEPRSLDYNYYGENGSTITYDEESSKYTVDPDGSGASNFSFYNPDFNFKSFRANVVFRYEVLPGSILYLVWTNDRGNYENNGDFNLSNDFTSLIHEEADNVFLMKFAYWLDI